VTIHSDLARATTVINEATSIALACHVNPDGDALGSMLALYHVLVADGRDVCASFSEPFVIAPHYRSLPGLEHLVSPHAFPAEPDVMVTFDCGSLRRLGDLAPAAKAARQLVVVDHHVSNDRYGTINVIDPTAASSGSVVRSLIASLGLPLNRDAAEALYCALVCDTGRFQYEATTADVFALAGELATFDIPIPELSRQLFEEHRFSYLQLVAAVLQRAELDESLHFVWSAITQDDLARFAVTIEETEGCIDLLRRTREADVTCMLREEPGGMVRVSLRSLGAVDVCAIAQQLGGGGHRYAAGFTSDVSIAATAQRVRSGVANARAANA
jgi:phosphoesterase RecJ-like protein